MDHSPASPGTAAPAMADAERRITRFLTTDMAEALRAVEHETPPLSPRPFDGTPAIGAMARARVSLSHVAGTADCLYRVEAFGDALLMSLQLNVRRFVAVYRVPVADPGGGGALVTADTLASRFERWSIGAGHAGWLTGWRDGTDPWNPQARMVETYCYAMLPADFLDNPLEQLYWRTDLVQMTRAFMLEARRMGIPLSAAA
ncbi:hypothetical protein M2352_004428 [Azospirillum fermentarium]|uniref:hypothetical protein n=1 Tax=Azospirillum fermentarium TaxID=1233114 RepID=UPI00222730FD|nr:hypothetical protein [Azospirillum fermentarium]MCW2248768.1 hypothetical protein [Azospirillum fermentarium]